MNKNVSWQAWFRFVIHNEDARKFNKGIKANKVT